MPSKTVTKKNQSTKVLPQKVLPQTVIKFDQVTKQFSKNNQKTFKEFIPALFRGEKTTESFTALDRISFEIKKGEVVGIIGPNGSGKSTILKLIAGVMSPTSGKITVHGKVSPLIELGAGMHPELTGRENIYLNGAILGLSRQQINKNIESIIDFSEIRDFIHQPVKHYSSGMYMRLAFSIAVHVNPEILLIDEILAVVVDFARRGPAIIQRQNAGGDPFGMKPVANGIGAQRRRQQVGGIDRFPSLPGHRYVGAGTQYGHTQPAQKFQCLAHKRP